MTNRKRLDQLLVERGFYKTRARARDAIVRGAISVSGILASKPGQLVSSEMKISVNDPALNYVSRAALKLLHALDQFAIDVSGKVALDVGASTGGFTQVLLERGVARVVALDVGHGQLDAQLRNDPRVVVMEGMNARDLTSNDFDSKTEIIVCDVSFISLKLALLSVVELAAPGTVLVALIKPQFEAGRNNIAKGGIVTDPQVHDAVCEEITRWLVEQGWQRQGLVPSPVTGGDGNQEFVLVARKQP